MIYVKSYDALYGNVNQQLQWRRRNCAEIIEMYQIITYNVFWLVTRCWCDHLTSSQVCHLSSNNTVILKPKLDIHFNQNQNSTSRFYMTWPSFPLLLQLHNQYELFNPRSKEITLDIKVITDGWERGGPRVGQAGCEIKNWRWWWYVDLYYP